LEKVIVAGGGLAGLISSIVLKNGGANVMLFERKKYPFHRVCGEYISNEVVPFLKSLNIPLNLDELPHFSKFLLTSIKGKKASLDLDLGGFGVSRYHLDEILYKKALELGVEVRHEIIEGIEYSGDKFKLSIKGKNEEYADVVLGAFGKRSTLDKSLGRDFIKKRSPYIGVKYHIEYDAHPKDIVALHNFSGGYCGINSVEEGKTNLCYLGSRENLKKYGDIPSMEENVLHQNPHLKEIWHNAKFLFDKPEVINEISFETKSPVENHVLMCGDAAGMITPLCGNGMAMAIYSAKMLSEKILKYLIEESYTRDQLENDYRRDWNKLFKNRLWVGRQLQSLFGSSFVSDLSVNLARYVPPVANYFMSKTHGKEF